MMASMKNIIFLGALSIALLLTACSDFLTESSQDEVRPSTTTDLEELLLGEGYASRTPIFPYLELLTDNVESNYSDATGQETMLLGGGPVFTWAEDMFEQLQKNNVPIHGRISIIGSMDAMLSLISYLWSRVPNRQKNVSRPRL